MACVIQVQEYITALHSACQCLESTATSKTAENKLQKALARVHKCEQASQSSISDTSKAGSRAAKAITAKTLPASQTPELADADTNPPAQNVPPAATDATQTPMQPVQTADVAMSDAAVSALHKPETDKHVHQSAAVSTAKQASAQPGEETVSDADKENVGASKEKARGDKEEAKAAREQEKAQKEAMKEQQNAEREQQRLQKEQQKAEKERQRLEKDQQKAEKEAEKERIRSSALLAVVCLLCLQAFYSVRVLPPNDTLLSISHSTQMTTVLVWGSL